MKLEERIKVLTQLGEHLQGEDEYLKALMHRASFNNAWFTIENQEKAVQAIAENFLSKKKLDAWLERYGLSEEITPKTVGIVMAGNIPLVGFHDLLCVFLAGHYAMIKLSDKDQFLLPYLLELMARFDVRTENYFSIIDQLTGFDAVIATGSNNSARYFEAYFGKYPHIIRKNRNGVAVLTGEETKEELLALGKDVFEYFGLGCRNVSKIYLPREYDFQALLESLYEYRQAINHSKYKNNFDYNYALFILNKEKYEANGCILLREDPSLQSRIACLHYEYYDSQEAIEKEMEQRQQEIQCIVARGGVLQQRTFSFGQAQGPELWDYADGVDTLDFLIGLNKQ